MANVQIVLEVDDRGTPKVTRFAKASETAAVQAATGTTRAFDKMATQVGARLDQMSTRFLKWGGLIGTVFGAMALRSVVSFGTEFQRRMSGVRAVTTEAGTSFEQMTRQARQLGATTVFTATESAEAMEELGKAGFTTTEIFRQMPAVLDLAAAGELEMAEAASIASDVLKIMGLAAEDFERAGDVIVKTSTNAKTTVSELGFAFQDSLPVARTLGLTIEEVSGSLGILANRGFVATRAGTALRRIYSVFLGDLEEGEKGISVSKG